MRVTCTEELQSVLHNLLAGKLAARKIIEYQLAVPLEKAFSLCDTFDVGALKLEPPFRFHLV